MLPKLHRTYILYVQKVFVHRVFCRYNNSHGNQVEITFDLAKDATNKDRHNGISLSDARRFDWSSVRYEVDTRRDYSEERYRGFGYIDRRLHMVAFTFRDGTMRVISLRKANPREVRDYEHA
jgi:uncharacterized DUF497 family protein